MRVLIIIALALAVCATATAAGPATSAQASAAIMAQAEDFYVEQPDTSDVYWYTHTLPLDLISARCRGKNGRFNCTAVAQRRIADGPVTIRIAVKARKAGGFCWAVPPKPIPSGCLAPGKRAVGELDDIDNAVAAKVGTAIPWFRATPHGSGFYSWYWFNAGVQHTGTVVYAPTPRVKVLS